ncbi:hypothetical protein [Novosphingobium sp.]|uniref:hypothetical protein n=1 Tax=Novosphingobium sp. TaxID=1874826 RepID=UPI00286C82BC|nr:hypothetical protein [Novosphingobium sp.]
MRTLLLLPLILLAGCSSEDKTAGGTTASEARALDDAAEMLEDRQLPPGSVPGGAPQPPASQPPANPPVTPSPGAKPTG